MKRLILITTLTFLFISSHQAAVIYVDQNATGSSNGSDWTNAYIDLQDALSTANSGDEIWVAEGSYTPDFIDREVSFEIPAGVEVYGGFEGTESLRGQRNWGMNPTILSGEVGFQQLTLDNSYTVVRIEEQGDEVVLDGFIIRDAFRETSGVGNHAAIVVSADCRISHCQVIENRGFLASGLFAIGSYNLTLDNNLFATNTTISGATLYQFPVGGEYAISINQCTFSGNDHENASDDVIVQEGHWEIRNSIFWGNTNAPDQLSVSLSPDSPIGNCAIEGVNVPALSIFNINPQFNAPSVQDYRLPFGSPVTDQADADFVVSFLDASGKPRQVGPASDVGCFEYQGERIIYVDPSNSFSLNDGTSWESAFTKLHAGVLDAVGGDELWVANGEYYPTDGDDRGAYLSLRNEIAIYGGFQGGEDNFEDRDWRANLSIVDGDIGSNNQLEDNSYTLFRSETGSNCVLDGLLIRRANANGEEQDDFFGGAVLVNSGSSLTIRNSTLTSNYAETGGTAIESDGDLEMINCIVEEHVNTVIYDGVIRCAGDLRVEGCLFTRNDVALNLILGYGDSMEIVNCTFYDNYTNGSAIRIFDPSSTGVVRNSVFSLNTFLLGPALEDDDILFDHCILDDHVLIESQIGNEVYFEDPLMLDPGNEDYRLCWSSVGHNNGFEYPFDEEAEDYNGYTRVFGERVDMGAFENNSSRQIVYVDESASGGENGTTWEDAFTQFQDGHDAAGCGAQIWVAQGVYKRSANDRLLRFDILTSVEIYGGFQSGDSDLSDRDWNLNPTILSGEIGNQNTTDDNSFITVSIDVDNGRTILDGFFVEKAYSGSGELAGGGLVTRDGNIRLQNLRVRDNFGTDLSGMRVYGDNTHLENCFFINNESDFGSTVKLVSDGHLNVVNCTFTNNIQDNLSLPVIDGEPGTQAAVINSIIYGNNSFIAVNTDFSAINCLLENGFPSGQNIIDADPQFVDPLSNNFQLQQISPAVDAGDNSYVKAEKDLLGNDRVVGLAVDLGCFELSSACPADLNNDGVVNTADLTALLSEFGCLSNCGPDLNGDSVVNTGDLQIFLANYGTECSDNQ